MLCTGTPSACYVREANWTDSLAALVDVEGDCSCGSVVAAGEGSCDSLITDQSRTTA